MYERPWGFVVNPLAGGGRGRQVWCALERLLVCTKVPYRAWITQRPGEAVTLAREAVRRGVRAVVAIGGDGTVHEVVNGMWETGVPLGCVPAGSGNDFVRALKIPDEPAAAWNRLCAFHVRSLDLVRVNGEIVVNAAGIGLDGTVAAVVNRSPYKRWLNWLRIGKAAYVVGLLHVLARYEPLSATLDVDGRALRFPRTWLVAISNLPFYGGGMNICPLAAGDDGQLDVCVVSGIGAGRLLRLFPRVFRGRHIDDAAITLLRGKEIRLSLARPLPGHLDGELTVAATWTAQVLPRALKVL
ncbi:diacylglycerol/lipid kinase family protein [Calditerricola yamamurae]